MWLKMPVSTTDLDYYSVVISHVQYSVDKNFRQIHRLDTVEELRRVEQIQIEWQLMVLSLDLVLSI